MPKGEKIKKIWSNPIVMVELGILALIFIGLVWWAGSTLWVKFTTPTTLVPSCVNGATCFASPSCTLPFYFNSSLGQCSYKFSATSASGAKQVCNGNSFCISPNILVVRSGSYTYLNVGFTQSLGGPVQYSAFCNGYNVLPSGTTGYESTPGNTTIQIPGGINNFNATNATENCYVTARGSYGIFSTSLNFTTIVEPMCPSSATYVNPSNCKSSPSACNSGYIYQNTTGYCVPTSPCQSGYAYSGNLGKCIISNACPPNYTFNPYAVDCTLSST